MHFAQGEVMKLEAQAGRDVGIGCLFVGQGDVEPNAEAAGLVAPRLAASMMPGPPPVQMNNLRPFVLSALNFVTNAPKARACS